MAEKLRIVLVKVQLSILFFAFFFCLLIHDCQTFQQAGLILKKEGSKKKKMWHHFCCVPLILTKEEKKPNPFRQLTRIFAVL